MRPGTRKSDRTSEFLTPERAFILEVANDTDDDGLSIARARVEPRVTTQWHELRDTDERYLIVNGQGRVEIASLAPTDVTVGDVVRIPANTPQRVTNTGDQDLTFYCICTPRFRADAYIAVLSLEQNEH